MSVRLSILPIGASVRVIHGSHYGSHGRVVRGSGNPPRGHVYVEIDGLLPGTSVLMSVTALEVAR